MSKATDQGGWGSKYLVEETKSRPHRSRDMTTDIHFLVQHADNHDLSSQSPVVNKMGAYAIFQVTRPDIDRPANLKSSGKALERHHKIRMVCIGLLL
jgi:hypothetical protein